MCNGTGRYDRLYCQYNKDFVCVHAGVCVCMPAGMCAHAHTHTHTHIYIWVHMLLYTVFAHVICALFFLFWPLKNRGA